MPVESFNNKPIMNVEVNVGHIPVINFSMQQNHVPVVREITIKNIGDEDLGALNIDISFDPEFAATATLHADGVAAGQELRLTDIPIQISTSYLSSLTERISGHICLNISTGDTSIFSGEWLKAVGNILATFRQQQRKDGVGPYKFQRNTERALDTMTNDGLGNPVRPVGLIASAFRPSDDATTFQFLVPSNFFAVTSLRKAAEILTEVNGEKRLASECTALADEVESALKQYAVYDHPEFGKIYAFEVDGFGNRMLMDDANVPSLLAMPYLGDVEVSDPVYQNTRRFVWSDSNPYFFKGRAGEGIGGPHVGYDMIWPMSIMMKAFTSDDDAEIRQCVEMLMATDAGTNFMHESFHKDNADKFTRPWFAWQNTLFGELIIKLIDDGRLGLLNSIE